jgi:hypothetical protein
MFSKGIFPMTEQEMGETIKMLDEKCLKLQKEKEDFKNKLTMLRSQLPRVVWVDLLKSSPYLNDWFDDRGIAK